MSITTKFGDGGDTRLYSGETVNKVSRRIAIVGDLDELVCVLGLAYRHVEEVFPLATETQQWAFMREAIDGIQRKLFIVGAEIATISTGVKLKKVIDQYEMNQLDLVRDTLEQKIQLPKDFILPGHDNKLSAYLDLARAVCRRCERSIVGAYNEGFTSNKYILTWMNRLSDYLYLLARYAEKEYTLVKEENLRDGRHKNNNR